MNNIGDPTLEIGDLYIIESGKIQELSEEYRDAYFVEMVDEIQGNGGNVGCKFGFMTIDDNIFVLVFHDNGEPFAGYGKWKTREDFYLTDVDIERIANILQQEPEQVLATLQLAIAQPASDTVN